MGVSRVWSSASLLSFPWSFFPLPHDFFLLWPELRVLSAVLIILLCKNPQGIPITQNSIVSIVFHSRTPLPCYFLAVGASGILLPWPGIEPMPSTLEVQGLNHCTTREAPKTLLLRDILYTFLSVNLNLSIEYKVFFNVDLMIISD